jgi:pyruvate-ferredoxin/flavodoxin oxidoreductase
MMSAIKIIDGNEAAASVAYQVSDVHVIYPISPSSFMGELVDQWAAENKPNIWGTIPRVVEMQSEGGAAGALHGTLQVGALATTYTSAQGLLLMIPNMYKIAGELTAAVFHVAARTIATHALSIFGDHSDVMGVRQTGFAILASGNVQEAQDLALIAHATTLEARVPFVHCFDGFRTSHEVAKIEAVSTDEIRAMIDDDLVIAHRKRALNPENPFIHGTAQNPDIYFQGRERSNEFYANVPALVTKYMEKFAVLTGRKYSLFTYSGDPKAERVIVIMGSGAKTAVLTTKILQTMGEKVGVVQVHLYRPFAVKQFIETLPATTRAIAVLDRTKETGAIGGPLYQDVVTALAESWSYTIPTVIGGCYGLASKDFTPSMAKTVFDELKTAKPKKHFTVGINDDVTNLSLAYDVNFDAQSEIGFQALFFGLGSDGTVGANKNTIKIIGEETDNFVQGYFVYDSKKSGSKTVSHLRFGAQPLDVPFAIQSADFIACHQFDFLWSINVLAKAKVKSVFLLNSPYSPEIIWEKLPKAVAKTIIDKQIAFYIIDAYKVAAETGMGTRINTVMQTCFFAISNVLTHEEAIAKIKNTIVKTYTRKGEDVVKKNYEAVDRTLANLFKVSVPAMVAYDPENPIAINSKAPVFVQNVVNKISLSEGDSLPVSAFPVDGAYPSATAQWERRDISAVVSNWNPELCIQCGQCSLICPHAVLRAKHFPAAALKNAPATFKSAPYRVKDAANEQFCLQVHIENCTGCGLCSKVCPATSKDDKSIKAIMLQPKVSILAAEKQNVEFFTKLPYNARTDIDTSNPRGLQFCRPLFEFSGACVGCGETPYLKLLTQLFGNRMLVANATGCSSIYGGDITAVPWAKDDDGRGPAWSNSLFEDNAEFGLGFRIGVDIQTNYAINLLQQFKDYLGDELVTATIQGVTDGSEAGVVAQRERVRAISEKLQDKVSQNNGVANLLAVLNFLINRSIWAIGGDGWAYDIGYGGLDHVLASGNKVKVLVVDTEVYSNTGGQASKATPLGAVAKFAFAGKERPSKDLGLMMMAYSNIYVAQIALGANPTQAIRAIREAESYNGPAIIIAYSHCVAHGYDLANGAKQQKLAVESGFWPLYRYNPDRVKQNLNPFQLDSQRTDIKVAEYIYNEQRFKVLLSSNKVRAAELEQQLQEYIDKRWEKYKALEK